MPGPGFQEREWKKFLTALSTVEPTPDYLVAGGSLPPTVPIVSKVGAGDSMVAGIVLGLARGKSLRESIVFGVSAGTAAVMTPGTELCRREDVERLYDQMI
jgi:fructose-1-phosphate kinase PfkB-like protein